MSKLFIVFFCLLPLATVNAQNEFSKYHYQRTDLFEKLPITKKDIVFVGNSITDGAEWSELLANKRAKNRGISADISQGVFERIETIVKGKPSKIFLMIGVNDIAQNIDNQTIINNIKKIVENIQQKSPKTKIYIQSILPVNTDFTMFKDHMKPHTIKQVNGLLQDLAQQYNVKYIDLYTHFVQEGTDKLNPKYTNDGLHLMGDGYMLWRDIILPYL